LAAGRSDALERLRTLLLHTKSRIMRGLSETASTDERRQLRQLRALNTMANSAQARKRARQSEVTRKRNATMRSTLRTAVKNVKKAIIAGDKAAAAKTLQISQGIIDRVADKKIVHKNLASRTKSRLAQAIKAMSA
jgi:small subunit ribosomal protein S20